MTIHLPLGGRVGPTAGALPTAGGYTPQSHTEGVVAAVTVVAEHHLVLEAEGRFYLMNFQLVEKYLFLRNSLFGGGLEHFDLCSCLGVQN